MKSSRRAPGPGRGKKNRHADESFSQTIADAEISQRKKRLTGPAPPPPGPGARERTIAMVGAFDGLVDLTSPRRGSARSLRGAARARLLPRGYLGDSGSEIATCRLLAVLAAGPFSVQGCFGYHVASSLTWFRAESFSPSAVACLLLRPRILASRSIRTPEPW